MTELENTVKKQASQITNLTSRTEPEVMTGIAKTAAKEELEELCKSFCKMLDSFHAGRKAGVYTIVCADSVTRGLVRDHPSMNMKIGTLVPGYVLSANLSL